MASGSTPPPTFAELVGPNQMPNRIDGPRVISNQEDAALLTLLEATGAVVATPSQHLLRRICDTSEVITYHAAADGLDVTFSTTGNGETKVYRCKSRAISAGGAAAQWEVLVEHYAEGSPRTRAHAPPGVRDTATVVVLPEAIDALARLRLAAADADIQTNSSRAAAVRAALGEADSYESGTTMPIIRRVCGIRGTNAHFVVYGGPTDEVSPHGLWFARLHIRGGALTLYCLEFDVDTSTVTRTTTVYAGPYLGATVVGSSSSESESEEEEVGGAAAPPAFNLVLFDSSFESEDEIEAAPVAPGGYPPVLFGSDTDSYSDSDSEDGIEVVPVSQVTPEQTGWARGGRARGPLAYNPRILQIWTYTIANPATKKLLSDIAAAYVAREDMTTLSVRIRAALEDLLMSPTTDITPYTGPWIGGRWTANRLAFRSPRLADGDGRGGETLYICTHEVDTSQWVVTDIDVELDGTVLFTNGSTMPLSGPPPAGDGVIPDGRDSRTHERSRDGNWTTPPRPVAAPAAAPTETLVWRDPPVPMRFTRDDARSLANVRGCAISAHAYTRVLHLIAHSPIDDIDAVLRPPLVTALKRLFGVAPSDDFAPYKGRWVYRAWNLQRLAFVSARPPSEGGAAQLFICTRGRGRHHEVWFVTVVVFDHNNTTPLTDGTTVPLDGPLPSRTIPDYQDPDSLKVDPINRGPPPRHLPTRPRTGRITNISSLEKVVSPHHIHLLDEVAAMRDTLVATPGGLSPSIRLELKHVMTSDTTDITPYFGSWVGGGWTSGQMAFVEPVIRPQLRIDDAARSRLLICRRYQSSSTGRLVWVVTAVPIDAGGCISFTVGDTVPPYLAPFDEPMCTRDIPDAHVANSFELMPLPEASPPPSGGGRLTMTHFPIGTDQQGAADEEWLSDGVRDREALLRVVLTRGPQAEDVDEEEGLSSQAEGVDEAGSLLLPRRQLASETTVLPPDLARAAEAADRLMAPSTGGGLGGVDAVPAEFVQMSSETRQVTVTAAFVGIVKMAALRQRQMKGRPLTPPEMASLVRLHSTRYGLAVLQGDLGDDLDGGEPLVVYDGRMASSSDTMWFASGNTAGTIVTLYGLPTSAPLLVHVRTYMLPYGAAAESESESESENESDRFVEPETAGDADLLPSDYTLVYESTLPPGLGAAELESAWSVAARYQSAATADVIRRAIGRNGLSQLAMKCRIATQDARLSFDVYDGWGASGDRARLWFFSRLSQINERLPVTLYGFSRNGPTRVLLYAPPDAAPAVVAPLSSDHSAVLRELHDRLYSGYRGLAPRLAATYADGVKMRKVLGVHESTLVRPYAGAEWRPGRMWFTTPRAIHVVTAAANDRAPWMHQLIHTHGHSGGDAPAGLYPLLNQLNDEIFRGRTRAVPFDGIESRLREGQVLATASLAELATLLHLGGTLMPVAGDLHGDWLPGHLWFADADGGNMYAFRLRESGRWTLKRHVRGSPSHALIRQHAVLPSAMHNYGVPAGTQIGGGGDGRGVPVTAAADNVLSRLQQYLLSEHVFVEGESETGRIEHIFADPETFPEGDRVVLRAAMGAAAGATITVMPETRPSLIVVSALAPSTSPVASRTRSTSVRAAVSITALFVCDYGWWYLNQPQ
jgi:hypothetical protein